MPEKPPYPPPRYYRHLSALLPLSPPLLLSLPCPLPLQILLIGLAHSPYCSYLHPCVLPTPQILPIGLLPPPPAPILAPAHLSPLQILPIGLLPLLLLLSSTQYSLLVSITERALATGF